jgi:hypothetical protein
LETLPDFDHRVRASVFELDVRRDIVLLALEEMKDLLDRLPNSRLVYTIVLLSMNVSRPKFPRVRGNVAVRHTMLARTTSTPIMRGN